MRLVGFFALTAGSLALSSAFAQPGARNVRYTVSADVRGEAPAKIFLDRAGAAPVALSPQSGGFVLAFSGPARVAEAQLRAVYSDGAEVGLGIRLVPQAPTIPVTFFRGAPAPCADGTVRPLEMPTAQVRTNLEAYFKARELAQGRASAPCGSTMKRRVARIWFDKSYQLATKTQHIAFDPDAAEYLKRLDPGSRPYVDESLKQIQGKRIALAYQLQGWALGQGDYEWALAVNQTLQQQVSLGEGRAAAELQQIDLKKLEQDATYLGGLTKSFSAQVPATTAASTERR